MGGDSASSTVTFLSQVIVMAMGLVGDALRGTKVHPTRYWLTGLVVHHGHMDPILAPVYQLQPYSLAFGHLVCQ